MKIVNCDSNVLNSVCDIDCLYNIKGKLAVLINGSLSIGYFESKVLKDG